MKLFKLTIIIITLIASLFAQGQSSVFQKHYDSVGQTARAFNKTKDGNYISVTTRLDLNIAKLDDNGDTLWTKRYAPQQGINGEEIKPHFENSYVLAGTKRNSSTAINEGFIVRVDSIGNTIWAKTLNLSGVETYISGMDVGQDSSIIVSGYYISGNKIGFISKISASGNLIWTQRSNNLSGDVRFFEVEYDHNGNIIVVGEDDNIGTIVQKLDPSGNVIWSKISDLGANCKGLSVEILPSNNILVAGRPRTGIGPVDFYIHKLDPSGNLIFSKTFGTGDVVEMEEMALGSNYNLGIFGQARVGNSDRQFMLSRIDSSGNIIYSYGYGNSASNELAYAGTIGHDNSNWVVGIQSSSPKTGMIVKTDSMGFVGCYTDTLNLQSINATVIYSNGPTLTSTTPSYQNFTWSTIQAVYRDSVFCSNTICNLSATASVTSNYNGSDITCNGASDGQVTVSVVGGSGTQTYNWSSGGTTSIESGLGNGTYYCIVTDGICVDTAYVTLTEPSPLIISTSGNVGICIGDSTNISASGANTYNWDNGAGPGSTVSVSPSITTQYIVTGTDVNNCQDTTQVTVTVNPLPNVSIQAYSPDTLCSTHTPVTLPNGTPVGGTYSGTGVTGGNFDPNLSGLGTHYTVYTYTDGNSCTNSDSTAITVNTCVGIKDITINNSVVISPNPNNGRFTITNNHLPIKALRIFNLLGKLVYSQKNISSFEVTVNEESVLPSGTYLLEIVDQEFNTYTHKILVK